MVCGSCNKPVAECQCYNSAEDNKVKNPASTHYEIYPGVEAIDVIKTMLTPEEYLGFLKGNILKYQLRLGKKDNIDKELAKIKDYTNEVNALHGC